MIRTEFCCVGMINNIKNILPKDFICKLTGMSLTDSVTRPAEQALIAYGAWETGYWLHTLWLCVICVSLGDANGTVISDGRFQPRLITTSPPFRQNQRDKEK